MFRAHGFAVADEQKEREEKEKSHVQDQLPFHPQIGEGVYRGVAKNTAARQKSRVEDKDESGGDQYEG